MTLPISIELYPGINPAGAARSAELASRLAPLAPAFVSVTDGAGGISRAAGLALSDALNAQGFAVAPHLSTAGLDQATATERLAEFSDRKAKTLFALRGDTPSGMGERGDFRYASDLVRFMRETLGDGPDILVAAYPEVHPQAKSAHTDLAALKAKQDAGATGAVTQYFYNADAYRYFADAAVRAGVTLPIVPGVLPLTRVSMARLAEVRGVELPRWMKRALDACHGDAAALASFGREVGARLVSQLIAAGAPGVHFFAPGAAEIEMASLILADTGLTPPKAA
ncbi:methylenetetrahydrofolate reductase [Crenobacter cavernae]|uniref:Methylenetetrahydrofolate reductase n=1 Tax=Crenobacter cavernae TaxID=2290923 RepID=A0A345Y6D1_9NEIS|nr:methylenetetrahydrofolate reductase [Crenobacter cavernae]AXK39483.1 methylenetetrahydrofolate reductase [NAD(P)H] [Crenobacter cavernae]